MESEAKQIFDDYIRERGLKGTAQRDLILSAFLSTEDHLTAEDIHRLVNDSVSHNDFSSDKKHGVGFATVYRTMKLITDSGLAREVIFGDGVSRFEHKYGHPHHHHLICNGCGEITEFSSQKMNEVEKHILKKYSFKAESHHFKIFGLCKNCEESRNQEKQKKSKKNKKMYQEDK